MGKLWLEAVKHFGKNILTLITNNLLWDSGVLPNYFFKSNWKYFRTYNGPSKQWWNDTTGGQFSITRNVKYITFNVQHPYTQDIPQFPGSSSSTNNGFQIVLGGGLTHDTSKSSTPFGYWLYHKELTAGSPGTISNMYDGQGRRSGGTNGSWNAATSTSPDAFVINTSSAVSPAAGGATTLQITIGVPNSLANAVIESIQIIFLKW